jgi:hypothetical protein
MRNWDINKILGAMMVLTTVVRLMLSGLLLWAFQEADTPFLKLSLWSIGVGMIIYSFWRVYKLRQFLEFDKTFGTKE